MAMNRAPNEHDSVSAAPSNQIEPFPFLELPLELRLMIYERLEIEISHVQLHVPGSRFAPDAQAFIVVPRIPLNILATSRIVNLEARKILKGREAEELWRLGAPKLILRGPVTYMADQAYRLLRQLFGAVDMAEKWCNESPQPYKAHELQSYIQLLLSSNTFGLEMPITQPNELAVWTRLVRENLGRHRSFTPKRCITLEITDDDDSFRAPKGLKALMHINNFCRASKKISYNVYTRLSGSGSNEDLKARVQNLRLPSLNLQRPLPGGGIAYYRGLIDEEMWDSDWAATDKHE